MNFTYYMSDKRLHDAAMSAQEADLKSTLLNVTGPFHPNSLNGSKYCEETSSYRTECNYCKNMRSAFMMDVPEEPGTSKFTHSDHTPRTDGHMAKLLSSIDKKGRIHCKYCGRKHHYISSGQYVYAVVVDKTIANWLARHETTRDYAPLVHADWHYRPHDDWAQICAILETSYIRTHKSVHILVAGGLITLVTTIYLHSVYSTSN